MHKDRKADYVFWTLLLESKSLISAHSCILKFGFHQTPLEFLKIWNSLAYTFSTFHAIVLLFQSVSGKHAVAVLASVW